MNSTLRGTFFSILVYLLLGLGPSVTLADLKITNTFYGVDEKDAKFQNSNVIIKDNGEWTPVLTKLAFDNALYTVPTVSEDSYNGYACEAFPNQTNQTALAGQFDLGLYFEDIDGGDGFQASRNWGIVPCDKNNSDGTPVTSWPVIGGAFANAELNNFPYFVNATDSSSDWYRFEEANEIAPDYLSIKRNTAPLDLPVGGTPPVLDTLPAGDPLRDVLTSCTTGNCLYEKVTTLLINLDRNCDNTPDTTAAVDLGDYIEVTYNTAGDPASGIKQVNDINGGLWFYAEVK